MNKYFYLHFNDEAKMYYRSIGKSIGEAPNGKVIEEPVHMDDIPKYTEGYTKARCLALFRDPTIDDDDYIVKK